MYLMRNPYSNMESCTKNKVTCLRIEHVIVRKCLVLIFTRDDDYRVHVHIAPAESIAASGHIWMSFPKNKHEFSACLLLLCPSDVPVTTHRAGGQTAASLGWWGGFHKGLKLFK